jgi:F0F1-type ATP synthase membrane subunit b/b'
MPLPRRIGAELKEQASEKVDQAKDKANELASDAKKKGEGRKLLIS